MKISTSTGAIIHLCGLKDAMQILADAGFDAVDHTISQNSVDWDTEFFRNTTAPAFAEYFKGIAKTTRGCGLEMYQCHAPYAPTYLSDMRMYTLLQKHIIRSIYAAGYMECPMIVAHPVLHAGFVNGQNRELARQTTLDHFATMIPALRDTGVTMCIENLFFDMSRNAPKAPAFCSDAEDLCDVIDTLNDMYGPHFAACLDTGHAALVQRDPGKMAKILGSRLQTLHINDNHGFSDEHLAPTRGMLDWKEIVQALGEINYPGTFNFEIDSYFTDFPKDIYGRTTLEHACRLLYEIGRSLADIAEGNRSTAE